VGRRRRRRHTRTSSKLCYKFNTAAGCSYGSKCRFVHKRQSSSSSSSSSSSNSNHKPNEMKQSTPRNPQLSYAAALTHSKKPNNTTTSTPIAQRQQQQQQQQQQQPKTTTATKKKQTSVRSEVLFFPDEKLPCNSFMERGKCYRGSKCDYAHRSTSFSRFLGYLASAKESVDVCVFTITNNAISDVLIDLHNSGVRVRIITDDEQSKSLGSDVLRLARAGIPCIHDGHEGHMHAKVSIVDNKLLMIGSFNYTRSAVLSNREHVIVSNDANQIRQFNAEFRELWTLFARNTFQ
jgi:cardiolipin hydrolase